jgi:hypothetical protein
MCGASKEQKNAYAQTQDVQRTLFGDFNKIFSGNTNILTNVVNSLNTIMGGGVGQFGYTPQETAALRGEAMASTAAATRRAAGVAGEQLAGIGGGGQVLPSGSREAILGDIAEKGAQAGAAAQQDITAKGYETGRQNYFQSEKDIAAAPGQLENPATQMGSQALAGTEALGQQGEAITKANQAWMAPVGGIIGGVASVATGGLLGKKSSAPTTT